MRYFFVAGERSGDLHASHVITQLKIRDPTAEITGWGGPFMAATGAHILTDYREAAYMGFWEVAKNWRRIRGRLSRCRQQMQDACPDVVVLVDFSGFNLPMARAAHRAGIPVAYYIAPKAWAWNAGRINQIRRFVKVLLVIFPFEEDYFKDRGVTATYVGNPVVEEFDKNNIDISCSGNFAKRIAFLPGSRPQEILKSIPVILQVAKNYPEFQIRIAAVDSVDPGLYASLHGQYNVEIVYEQTYAILKAADAAVITSGTATLEGALAGVPQVVVYKTSWLTYAVARMLIHIQFISLVNILAGRKVVCELIQRAYNHENLIAELDRLLYNETYKRRISEGYSEIRHILGKSNASEEVARIIDQLGRS